MYKNAFVKYLITEKFVSDFSSNLPDFLRMVCLTYKKAKLFLLFETTYLRTWPDMYDLTTYVGAPEQRRHRYKDCAARGP
jgi:hypothetical protein